MRPQGDAERFDLLHSREHDKEASLLAFDLLELNGTEVRKQPLVERKELLGDLLKKVSDGIEYSDHLEGDGNTIFEQACELGHQGIVAKRGLGVRKWSVTSLAEN